MPIKLGKVNGPTREVSVDFDGEALTLTYNPGKLTPKLMARMNEGVAEKDMTAAASFFATVCDKWDVVEDDGKTPVPLTAESVEELLSVEAMSKIVTALVEAQSPNPLTPAVSEEPF